ncbi:hypothetical protein V2J09_015110 [Rumex salicifolius]
MVKTGENTSNIAPFLAKCYEMVDDGSTDKVISWSQSGDSFVIWDMTEFSRDLLPKFFKHSNFSSFMRQLNIYGFRKMGFDRWEFYNELFLKGQKQLLSSIKRRKHHPGSAQPKVSSNVDQPVEVVDKFDLSSLEKEVEALKTDKNVLMQELVQLREHQANSQEKLILLRERLQGMETSQQQLLSFLVIVMQNPALLSQLLTPKENCWRMAETNKITIKDGSEDGRLIRYQPPTEEAATPVLPLPDSETIMEHDLSFDAVKDILMNIDFTSFPIDESFLLSEPRSPIKVPDHDLFKIEQFLLSSPTRDSAVNADLDTEKLDDTEMEAESVFSGQQFQTEAASSPIEPPVQ